MSFDVLANIYRSLSHHVGNGTVLVYWHGGEPLIAGLEFYKRAIALQRDFAPTLFRNHMISNLTLCNEEWADFFAQHNFFVATSLDGPQQIHDKNRRHFNQSGTYDEVFQSIDILRRHKATIEGGIATLHRGNIRSIEEIYRTYRMLRLNLTLGYMTPTGIKVCKPLTIPEEEYYTALRLLMELWLLDPDPIEINVFEAIIDGLMNPRQVKSCLEDIIGFDVDGAIFPCHAAIGYNVFNFGKISSDYKISSANSAWQSIKDITYDLIEYCNQCEVFGMCDGLCPYSNSILHSDPNHKPKDCGPRKEFFLWAKERLSPYLINYNNDEQHGGS